MAQDIRSVTIRDGRVFVDGHPVPPEALPASLRLQGLNQQFSFVGAGDDVVVDIGGTLYRLDGRRLLELKEPAEAPGAAPSVTVAFRGRAVPPTSPSSASFVVHGSTAYTITGHQVDLLQEQAALLEAQAADVVRLNRMLDLGGPEYGQVAARWRRAADQLSMAAQTLPRLEWQGYLHDVAQKDLDLYHRLVEEQQLEAEAQALAAEIRRQYGQAQREEQIRLLRRKLEEIFELKQENRRAEIRQLEAELDDLRERLAERERLREEIVERRLRELIGERDDR